MTDDFADVIQSEPRLEALRRTSLSDSPPEDAFDRLTRMATAVLRVSMSMSPWSIATRLFSQEPDRPGEPLASLRQGPLQHSFCEHAVRTRRPSWCRIPRKPHFERYLAISGLEAIAYAGVPLITSEGHALGTFLRRRRAAARLTDEELQILRVLATARCRRSSCAVSSTSSRILNRKPPGPPWSPGPPR
jgi:GAF domain-containing protein